MAEAVVIGAGHNGLVAANLLADDGWDVVVLEASPWPGGAVRSDESVQPGFVTDLFSSFYPLGAASPVLAALELEHFGLQWTHAPSVLTHLLPDGRAATLHRDAEATAQSVDGFAPGDGDAWLHMFEQFERIREPLLRALFQPFPPVRPTLTLLRTLGAADALRLARFAVTPIRRAGVELFDGEGAPLLLAGNALHTDLPPEGAGSALYGWMLAMLGQAVGFPVPVGGSGQITAALVARLLARGGQLRVEAPVERISISGGAASGVILATGARIDATRAVLADVAAPALYRDLVGLHHLPPRLAEDLNAFEWDAATMKINWALRTPIPWTADDARGAGTVHLGVDMDGLTRYATDLATKQFSEHPFVLLGQMTTADASRSPAGTESVWAYTHLPVREQYPEDELAAHVERIEQVIERHAPGFGAAVLARTVQAPKDLEADDANLLRGAVNAGTASLHQQLVFRPIPGLARSETPIERLYLAGASAHPGGGVHGGPGANAARAALSRDSARGRLRAATIRAAHRHIYR
jgi:phytoene dehydrogenase-like protein